VIGAEQQKNTIRKNGVRIALWHDTILSNTIIPYEETYPTSGKAVDVAMCPASEAFQKAIVAAADKVRAAGTDAIYLDQISEMRSYLCFDPNHGHTTPATAYYEGYSQLLNDISNVMDRYGQDWFLLCEGVCDCYYDYHFNIRTVSISYQKCLNFVLRCALLPRKPTIFIVEGKAFVLMEIQIQIKNCENCKAY